MEDLTPHGQIVQEGRWAGSRRCTACTYGYHGWAYTCQHYPPEVKEDIASKVEKARNLMATDQWGRDQIARGVPPEGIAILRFFMGIE